MAAKKIYQGFNHRIEKSLKQSCLTVMVQQLNERNATV